MEMNMDVPDKQSFVIYNNFYEPIKHLSNTDLGKLFRAIFEYQLNAKKVNGVVVPHEIKTAFEFFKNQFALDDVKWMKRVEASRENGLKGGRPPQPRKPSRLSGLQKEPRKPDTVTVTVNDTEKENVIKPPIPPWLDQKMWEDFVEHRKGNRKKMTTRAIEMIFEQLEEAKAQGQDPNKILKTSIINGWQGIFPDKSKPAPPPPPQPREAAEQPFSPGTLHIFKIEIANMSVPAAKILWEKKPKSFREHPRLLQIYNNKLKEEHDPEIL